jgi:hypothetical protein
LGQRGQQSQVPWCVWVVDMLGQNLHRHAAHDALDVIDEV